MRFKCCSRKRCTRTTVPVGRWVSSTQLAVLLIFWPPGPPPRVKNSSISSGRIFNSTARASVCGGSSMGKFMGEVYRMSQTFPSFAGRGGREGHREAEDQIVGLLGLQCATSCSVCHMFVKIRAQSRTHVLYLLTPKPRADPDSVRARCA